MKIKVSRVETVYIVRWCKVTAFFLCGDKFLIK